MWNCYNDNCYSDNLNGYKNKIKMSRKPGKRQKENPARCTEEGKRWKGNIREGSREGKAGTVLSWDWREGDLHQATDRHVNIL